MKEDINFWALIIRKMIRFLDDVVARKKALHLCAVWKIQSGLNDHHHHASYHRHKNL
jgi:hypothetical protein